MTKQVSFPISDKGYERLVSLKHRTRAESLTEVLVKATSIYEALLEYRKDDGTIIIPHGVSIG